MGDRPGLDSRSGLWTVPIMGKRKKDKQLETDLLALLEARFEGLAVAVGHSERWDRMCVTFTWSGFADLLSEERYHRLRQAIPDEFVESRLAGFVWLELAPNETIDAFLKLPRSEDVADREATLYAALTNAKFFDVLGKAMGASPDRTCGGGFAQTVEVLVGKKYTVAKLRDVKLMFIRHGVYCDCQVLQVGRQELADLYAGAA